MNVSPNVVTPERLKEIERVRASVRLPGDMCQAVDDLLAHIAHLLKPVGDEDDGNVEGLRMMAADEMFAGEECETIKECLLDSAAQIERLTAQLSSTQGKLEEARKAMEELTAACEEEFVSQATESQCSDDETVSGGENYESPITFGMIRRARAALSSTSKPEGK